MVFVLQIYYKEAKAQGASLVIFPEDSVFSWLNPDVFLEAAPIPGKYSDEFVAIAKDENIWLAAGLGEQGPQAGPGSQKGIMVGFYLLCIAAQVAALLQQAKAQKRYRRPRNLFSSI
jgi:predicted amidohydrolase